MNKEEKVKNDCKECVNYDRCSHCLNGCSLFVKRRNIVLEIDGARHVLKEDGKRNVCSCCSLNGFCNVNREVICVALDDNGLYHFELENNEEVMRRYTVLEIDGVRHALKPDGVSGSCFTCSLEGFCDESRGLICSVITGRDDFHFEVEKDEGQR